MARLRLSQVFEGVFSLPDAVKMLGVQEATFRTWVKKGWVEAPNVPIGKRYCYSQEQIERLAERLKDFE